MSRETIATLFALGCWGALAIWMVWYFSKLFNLLAKAIESIKEHSYWQDDEHERLRQRVARNENRLNDISDMHSEFKKEIISHRKKINDFLLQQRKKDADAKTDKDAESNPEGEAKEITEEEYQPSREDYYDL